VTAVCRRCGRSLGAETYTVTLTASAESSGTLIEFEVCQRCFDKVHNELQPGRVPA
jgi:ribosomal protein L40E